MEQEKIVERLTEIINKPTSTPEMVAEAKRRLQELSSIGAAQVKLAATATGDMGDASLGAILDALQKLVQSGGAGAGNVQIMPSQVRDAVLKELKIRKIEKEDLSPSLMSWLQSTRPVQLTIDNMGIISKQSTSGSPLISARLTQLILSDMASKNNVYLYGAAGTGKTFIANFLAKELGYKLITLNCNQYTAPLDIIGGQTIDGYQEGKLTMAWSNVVIDRFGKETKYEGCVLLLDELPKIDPNTAGILNEALAKVKQYDYSTTPPTPPTILNGRNEEFSLKTMFVIATGNVPLNTIDPDYEANFKQDLSLQDRFIGSTYKVFYNYRNEFDNILRGYAFLFIFCVKLREAVLENKATSQAFVSTRLMENLKATYYNYRAVKSQNSSTKTQSLISSPKTIENALDTFFGLFKPAQRDTIMNSVDYNGFKKILKEKDSMPFDKMNPDFDTEAERREGRAIVDRYEKQQENQI